ncbi:hypothetical protein OUZ56_008629 [Daphnia magna]|uniref:Uncharacterized protein n=1 Tax=Daphnia magna TaxID=35525 RepID=A0ABR0ADJ9_9CRUS|nr:hypothetical protein OUZ56_008629 [Daphnia magna]
MKYFSTESLLHGNTAEMSVCLGFKDRQNTMFELLRRWFLNKNSSIFEKDNRYNEMLESA